MDPPNIFRFATSELSQDAMLCWLAAFACLDAPGHDWRVCSRDGLLDLDASVAKLRGVADILDAVYDELQRSFLTSE